MRALVPAPRALLVPLLLAGCLGDDPMFPEQQGELLLARTASAKEHADPSVIGRWLEMFNTSQWDIADEICTADVVVHIPHFPTAHDRATYKALMSSTDAMVREFHATLDDVFHAGDRLVGRFTAQGKMLPHLVPYTNTWIVLFRFEGGRIAEEWWELDLLGVQQQLGSLPGHRLDYGWGAPSAVTGDPGFPQRNASLARRVEAFLGNGNEVMADRVLAPDFVNHEPFSPYPPDRAGFKATIVALRSALPDLRCSIEDMVADADRVAVRRSCTGTHLGEFMGTFPPSGNTVQWTGMSILRIANGRIVENWSAADALGMILQMMGS
jgi:predicted ester cyclase